MEALAINYLKKQPNFLNALPNYSTSHFWALIAFLTAAISFSWKIKSSIQSSPPPPHHHHSFTSPSSNHQPTQLDDQLLPSSTTSSTPPASLTPSTTFCRLENRRSGKFSLHYGQTDHHDINIINTPHNQQYYSLLGTIRSHQQQERGTMGLDYDDIDDEEEEEEEEEEEPMMMGTSSIKHVGYWEADDDVVLVKMKTIREMMGWYRYQDLSVLHGNVVRLWTH
ncbi:hypothetical protein L6452_21426 [Arctium lappa]|uniref:Uncharacterized protein n=1 Tax=Arctium lappa TaxID=4217 RepID=A0ACB9AW53_ARCLA|nr:hypothetical protein L6452_21426 [Arctium lappa]